MTHAQGEYADFVEHPRFGRGPIFTGLNPQSGDAGVFLHWNAPSRREALARYERATGKIWNVQDDEARHLSFRIAGTAIAADVDRQVPAAIPVTHYFDVQSWCRDCRRPFLFFAREQKYWYEVLGFSGNSLCVRCAECRQREHELARSRRRYEELIHLPEKSWRQLHELADACLALVEAGIFSRKQLAHVRSLLNTVDAKEARKRRGHGELRRRLLALEGQSPRDEG